MKTMYLMGLVVSMILTSRPYASLNRRTKATSYIELFLESESHFFQVLYKQKQIYTTSDPIPPSYRQTRASFTPLELVQQHFHTSPNTYMQ